LDKYVLAYCGNDVGSIGIFKDRKPSQLLVFRRVLAWPQPCCDHLKRGDKQMTNSKRKMSIRMALEWAFMTEYVELDLSDGSPRTPVGVDTLYKLIKRNELGFVRIEGGGKSEAHEDANLISLSITKLALTQRRRNLALMVADCARFGRAVDWMDGAVPKIEPAEWKVRRGYSNQDMAKEAVLRRYVVEKKIPHPRNPEKSFTSRSKAEDSWCPCIWTTSLQEIETARADYEKWIAAMKWVRDDLIADGKLETIELTNRLPDTRPWRASA
jgi:hypothetical protein